MGGRGAKSAAGRRVPDVKNIEVRADTEVNDVQTIGKINREIFKVVTDDIQTDEVIITNVQIEHIKESHPNDFERYFQYAKTVVEDPDYILEANKPNSAVLLKSVEESGKHYKLILRLKTVSDPEEYKNSIITFQKVEEKRYNRYLRTKKVLYKRE